MKMKLRFQIVTHQVKRVTIIIISHTKSLYSPLAIFLFNSTLWGISA